MESGSRELTRLAMAYAASIAFGVTFLMASWSGCNGTTALLRGALAVIAALLVTRMLAAPVVQVVLDALARDTARKAEARAKEQGDK